MPVVYILLINNGQYYIGSTNDIDRRIHEHNSGKTNSTRNKRPVKLVFSQQFSTLSEARRIEYELKKLKSRKILEKIISNGFINSKLLGV